MKYLPILSLIILITSCKNSENEDWTKNFPKQQIQVTNIPKKENIWVFIMAGQSNMAGRGLVEPQDTIRNDRILTINKKNEIVYAKEPFHFYEPTMTGLDLGMSFGKELVKQIPDSVSVLIIPTAVGGSSIEQWIENQKHRDVVLFSNLKEKMELGRNYGFLKGILWHQGESDTKEKVIIEAYDKNLASLISKFREVANDKQLPVIIGELGSYSNNKSNWKQLNSKILTYSKSDSLIKIVSSSGLKDKGDKLHFDSKSIRIFGKRYAEKYLELKVR